MTDLGPKDKLILRRDGYEVWYHKSVRLYVVYDGGGPWLELTSKREAIRAVRLRIEGDVEYERDLAWDYADHTAVSP